MLERKYDKSLTSPSLPHKTSTRYISLLFGLFILAELLQKQVVDADPAYNKQLPASPLIPDFLANQAGFIIMNPVLNSTLSTAHIYVDDRLYEKNFTREEVAKARLLCEKALSEILKENSWVPKGQLLVDLQTKRLIIVLIPATLAFNEGSSGLYSVKDGQLGIVYKSSEESLAYYKMALLNELVTHLIVAANKRCGVVSKDPADIGMQFLKKTGAIDSNLRKQLEASINIGIEKIQYIKHLWKERKKIKLTLSDRELLHSFLAATKQYTPKTLYTSLSQIGGQEGFNQAVKTGIFIYQGGYIEPGTKYPADLPFFYGYIKNGVIIQKNTRNPYSLKGKVTGFLGDFTQMLSSINSTSGAYATKNENIKLSELASFVSELPARLLNVLFPEFQQLQKWYLLRCSPFASNKPPEMKSSFKVTESTQYAGFFLQPKPSDSNKKKSSIVPPDLTTADKRKVVKRKGFK